MNRVTRNTLSALFAGTMLLSPAMMAAQSATPMASPMATPIASPVASCTNAFRVIGQQILPNDLEVDGTRVGGLSGIDYDATNNVWYMLSDDRSNIAPARFYTGSLDFTDTEFSAVNLQSMVTLLNEDGQTFPNAEDGGIVPDPESIRVDPTDPSTLWWTSEGDYNLDLDPMVSSMTTDGTFVNRLETPVRFQASMGEELGPRNNNVWEGLTFSADGETLWIADEGPLYQDGDVSTFEHGATTRIINMSRQGDVIAEYAFALDALPKDPEDRAGDIGVTELLAIDTTRFLLLERATVQNPEGAYINYIKVYLIDTAGATDVQGIDSLVDADYTPVRKTLLLDMNACGLSPIDNMEGLAWGPTLENGNRSLVMIADNNFNETEVQIVYVFEVPADL